MKLVLCAVLLCVMVLLCVVCDGTVVCDGAMCGGVVRGGGGAHDDGAVWSVMVLLCVMVLCVMVVLWMTVLLHVHDGQVVMAGSLHLQGGPHATLSVTRGAARARAASVTPPTCTNSCSNISTGEVAAFKLNTVVAAAL